MSDSKFATIAVRHGIERDSQHGSVVPAIYMSSTYALPGLGQKRDCEYSRTANPTRCLLAEALAELEGGAGAVITATGMAAVHLVTYLLPVGAKLVIPHDCYGGSYRLFSHLAARGQFQLHVVDFTDHDIAEQLTAIAPQLIWIETPSNPLLRVTDISLVCAVAQKIGAKVAADNTFLSPALLQPLRFGVDYVVHSTTKYINGHSDLIGGAVIAKRAEDAAQLAWWANCLGVTGSAFDSYLTLRGLRTLPLRIKQHESNAQTIAEFLAQHPKVAQVYYPGLPSHPQHELASRQQKGYGAVISFRLQGGYAAAQQVVNALQHFSLAQSLGGVESLISHPATMTHAGMDPVAREKAGVTDSLLRLSVGIEDVRDLLADLTQALATLEQPTAPEQTSSRESLPNRRQSVASSEEEVAVTCRLSPALAALW